MPTLELIGPAVLALLLSISGSRGAAAMEPALDGAWIQGGIDCSEAFAHTRKGLTFKQGAALAPAFIISGKRIRTPHASCSIKGVKSIGTRRNLRLACTTGVSTDEAPAFLEPGDGYLQRYFNNEDPTGTRYQRCS